MNIVYIGLGSNLESPTAQVLSARRDIAALPDVTEIAFSNIYVSVPMGPQDQPDYINSVMGISTHLEPLALLHALQAIESAHGRVRGKQRWGARTLDLDLLLYNDQQINSEELTVPHPGIANRAFVLYPLQDCNPDMVIAGKGNLADLIKQCPATGIRRITDNASI